MRKRKIIIIANRIRSVYNVGAIFRTADAIGAEKLILAGPMATPKKEPRLAKTALGAELTLPWEHVYQLKPTLKKLKEEGYEIIALELKEGKSIDFRDWNPTEKVAIILGNEVSGVSSSIQSQCEKIIHLPMLGMKNSLNVSVAFGAIAYYILSLKKT